MKPKHLTLPIIILTLFLLIFQGSLDSQINQFTAQIRTSFFNNFFLAITTIANPPVLAIISMVTAGILLYKKQKNSAALLAFAMITGVAFKQLLKYIIQRPRPENAFLTETGYSFPSGHTTMSTIFFLVLIFILQNKIKSKTHKNIFNIIAILLFILIGLSRVYFNVHWFSDIIAGFVLGLLWTIISIHIFQKKS